MNSDEKEREIDVGKEVEQTRNFRQSDSAFGDASTRESSPSEFIND